MYTIVTENDESKWDDKTGDKYHFPNKYLKFLQPGTSVIYYKGGLKNRQFRDKRLSDEPHYFGVAKIGAIVLDDKSNKNHYCTIVGFASFGSAVLAKAKDGYIEIIPASRESNYWRDGVRPITKETYELILSHTLIAEVDSPGYDSSLPVVEEYESYQEGNPKSRFTTVYERNPALRKKAIEIHGTSCQACRFNFGEFYGERGEGYIHVHHLKPMADVKGVSFINPAIDLCVLCANCHSMVHRFKDSTLSIEELKVLISSVTYVRL